MPPKDLTQNNAEMTSNIEANLALVMLENENYYKISNYDSMRPFFMSIVSDGNHWMFISSSGGLTAGRKSSDYALFPYYTDDKITDDAPFTGSKTIIQCQKSKKLISWEPFREKPLGANIERNIYKSVYGNKIIFEEINHDLALGFQYQYANSDVFGIVKKSIIVNYGKSEQQLTITDGLQNIMPAGVSSDLQVRASNLVDAYKRTELQSEVGLGIFALSAIIVDKAEPSEALTANIVWSLGIEYPTYLLSTRQLEKIKQGQAAVQETDIKGEKGSYFVHFNLVLPEKSTKEWQFVADVNKNHAAISQLIYTLKKERNLPEKIKEDIQKGTHRLKELVGSADGFQCTGAHLYDARHYSNVLFNIMRGGVFDEHYQVDLNDFKSYLQKANRNVFNRFEASLAALTAPINHLALANWAEAQQDTHLIRLTAEYLPLKFSRRHGDPSRPWNKFTINTKDEVTGGKILDYEGNWRDIFQNWEALAAAYPFFIEGMMYKFLNASTFDGYNPYRVTKDGFDWEVSEPNDPWSYIGYWGDHQIIYLLKFLEFAEKHFPGFLAHRFNKAIFVYANVPYVIKSYADIVANPKDTIVFDHAKDEQINAERLLLGADAALLKNQDAEIYQVNLMEKLLATILAKVANYIPEGGIWMNTQRPEWNDANNALVGNGVSMVTLNYLHRFLSFLQDVLSKEEDADIQVSQELAEFYQKVVHALSVAQPLLREAISDSERRKLMDALGQAASVYRAQIYTHGFVGQKVSLSVLNLRNFVSVTLAHLVHAIQANERADQLYHAYNILTLSNNEAKIEYLTEMLEGQVAVLSSGYLSPKQSLQVLNALKKSALFREDQYSYLLYPNKQLAGFLSKNIISASDVIASPLLKALIQDKNKAIVEQDINGAFHFNANFRNANELKEALQNLSDSKYASLIETEASYVLQLYEKIFNHKAFTGRSGTFYGYEGLGSIYWHMVSKLLLAVQECSLQAIQQEEDPAIIGKLLEHYYEINEGIGVYKSPQLYGAFPTDPYSHTPAHKGVQQPGMTGQVKEDVISRFGELGVVVKNGLLSFYPCLLRKAEFLKRPKTFEYVDVNMKAKALNLAAQSLAFTYCQVPIVYAISKKQSIKIHFADGSFHENEDWCLDKTCSQMLFERNGKIIQIEVQLTSDVLK